MRAYVLWTMAILIVSGCASATKSRGQKASRDFDHEYDVVYTAVKSIFLSRGYEIVEDDPDAGVLETNWIVVKRDRTQAQARISPRGQGWTNVQIEILHDKRGLTGGDWNPEPVKVSVYRDLLEDIDTQAYREYFLRIERPDTQEK